MISSSCPAPSSSLLLSLRAKIRPRRGNYTNPSFYSQSRGKFAREGSSFCRMEAKNPATASIRSSLSGKTDFSHPFQCPDGLRSLAETGRFKVWFLDQFGVLHDGKQPYPGAVTALEKLANHGAKIIIISNSSRRASTTLEKMKKLGFNSSLLLGAITSGEITHEYLQSSDASSVSL